MPADLESIKTVSQSIQFLLRKFADPDCCEAWLCDLAIWTEQFQQRNLFGDQAGRVVARIGVNSVTTVAPWNNAPNITISGASAHQCAIALLTAVHLAVFDKTFSASEPWNGENAKQLVEYTRRQVKQNLRILKGKVKKLEEVTDYSAMLKLASRVEAELCLITEQKPEPMTELLTKAEIATAFSVGKNKVDDIIRHYKHEAIAGKFRFPISIIPPKYHSSRVGTQSI